MKIVRKILRLLPFLILLSGLIFYIFSVKEQYPYIIENDGTSPYFQFFNTFNDALIEFGDPIFSIFDLNADIRDILQDYFLIESSVFVPIDLVLSIMIYELFLSIIFLFFDVFNFMITIASNWLRKGERLNE